MAMRDGVKEESDLGNRWRYLLPLKPCKAYELAPQRRSGPAPHEGVEV